MKNRGETRNIVNEEINQNNKILKKHKNVCMGLNYMEHLLILASGVTGYISTSAFVSLVGISIKISSSAVGLKICAITSEIKKYKRVINKKNNKHDKIVLLAKTELNSIEVLISRALIDSYISHDEFISVNFVLKEYDDIKETIKNSKAVKRYD